MLAGVMIEPRVSLPRAKPTRPAAVADAGPADDPLDPDSGLQGLRVVPPNHTPPCASDPIDSLATSTAPAGSQAFDDGGVEIQDLMLIGSRAPGGRNALGGDRSLAPQGTPCRGP